ncbi:hypothetical protein D3C85_570830 [compost metagenome]
MTKQVSYSPQINDWYANFCMPAHLGGVCRSALQAISPVEGRMNSAPGLKAHGVVMGLNATAFIFEMLS